MSTNSSTRSLWTTLRQVSGYGGSGYCKVWAKLAEETLKASGYDNIPYGSRIIKPNGATDLQNFIKTKIPEGNTFRVRGENIKRAVGQFNNWRGRLFDLILPDEIGDNTEFIGYAPGIQGEEAILDGTADQIFEFNETPQTCVRDFTAVLHLLQKNS